MSDDMRVGVLTNAFREREMIVGCIDQFQDHYLPWHHQVLVSNKPWHGNWHADDTHMVAVNKGVATAVGTWENASKQLNAGLDMFGGYDWVVICDADERYTKKGLTTLWNDLAGLRNSDIGAVRTRNWSVYWKTPMFEIFPPQTDYPLIAIRPSERFGHIRSYDGKVGWSDAHMYHLSYVRTDEQMLKKVQSFDASLEFNPYDWYTNVWKKWTQESQNLHPVVPEQFRFALRDPIPEELWKFIPDNVWGTEIERVHDTARA